MLFSEIHWIIVWRPKQKSENEYNARHTSGVLVIILPMSRRLNSVSFSILRRAAVWRERLGGFAQVERAASVETLISHSRGSHTHVQNPQSFQVGLTGSLSLLSGIKQIKFTTLRHRKCTEDLFHMTLFIPLYICRLCIHSHQFSIAADI